MYDYYGIISRVIKDRFDDEYTLRVEVSRVVEAINQADPDRAADVMSSFVSEKMAGGADFDLQDVLVMFKHLPAKDVFMQLYNQRLVKRLVAERSAGLERERAVVEVLKAHAGEYFVSSSEQILSQFERSGELMRRFEAHYRSRKLGDGLDAQVVRIFVFPSHAWPFPKFVAVDDCLP